MCTTIGFSYKEGMVFGRTLELGISLDHKILVVPKNQKDFITGVGITFPSKYATMGSGFFTIASFGDGINEKGLMGSSNFIPKYASFAKEAIDKKLNMTTSNAFDYLLSRCEDVDEVREEAKKIRLLAKAGEDTSTSNHFFFMDASGNKVVLEPSEGVLICHDNPYGVLTNSPDFGWHATNLKNYLHLRPENREERTFNGINVTKFGEGTGMMGLPGDFTPPSRFVRAAYFVSSTPKNLDRESALLQGLRILSQFDIPSGSVVEPKENHQDQALYTSMMDTKTKTYLIKCHDNINVQAFRLEDYENETEIKFISLEKSMIL